jgi:phage repressor protein C with HTH and peptisase S24 domain
VYIFINLFVELDNIAMTHHRFDIFFERVSQATGLRTLSDLADLLRVNRSAVTQARKKDSVPATWLLHLYRQKGLNPDWLEGGPGPDIISLNAQGDQRYRAVPKVKARLCAGGGSFEVASEIEGYYSFENGWLQSKGDADQMVLMDVFGHSMKPEIKDGDTVLVDQAQKDVIAGAIYAVGIEDTIMIKRLEKHPQKLVLLSDNKEFSPIFLSPEEMDSIRIIGKVLWVCREMR